MMKPTAPAIAHSIVETWVKICRYRTGARFSVRWRTVSVRRRIEPVPPAGRAGRWVGRALDTAIAARADRSGNGRWRGRSPK